MDWGKDRRKGGGLNWPSRKTRLHLGDGIVYTHTYEIL